MDQYTLAFATVFTIVLLFFLHQFQLLSLRGFIFGLAAVALAFGFSWFRSYRKRQLQKELARREPELQRQEKRLQELQERYDVAKEEIREAEEALKRERARYLKEMLEIDAEKSENLPLRREQLNNMSPEEVFEEYQRVKD